MHPCSDKELEIVPDHSGAKRLELTLNSRARQRGTSLS